MSEEVVGLARKDGRLVAIVSVATKEQEQSPVQFALGERPVVQVRAALRPPMGRAVEAWDALRVPSWDDPFVLSSALTVMIETVPLGSGGAGPRPHAAQAGLCAPDAWRRLRDALRARESRVLRLLRRAGYGAEVGMLAQARDPYVAYHHCAPGEPGVAALPPRFVTFVLPLLRSRPWATVRRALAVFWGLGLQDDEAMLALAVRLLARGREHGLDWLEWMAGEEPARRETVGRVLLETTAIACDPATLPARTLDVLAEEDGASYADQLALVFRALCEGADPEHVLEGIRIVRTFSPDLRFPGRRRWSLARHPRVPSRVDGDLWRLLDRFRETFGADWTSTLPVALWEWCAAAPGRAAILRRPSLLAWPAHTTLHLLWALQRGVSEWNEDECLAIAERVLRRVPATHHPNALEELFEVLRKGRLDPSRLAAAVELVVRLSRPPFRTSCTTESTANLLVTAAGTRADRLAHLPERSLVKLERALRTEEPYSLRLGLASMGRICSAFLLDVLAAHPEPLLSAARRLGRMSRPRRLALLKRFRAHVVSQRRFANLPLERVCGAIESLVRRGLPNPMPRKLREHREGVRMLSSDSLERHRQAIVRRLLPFRLALLVRMALEDLDRGMEMDLSSEGERHALEMLGSVSRNRRLLRRVLRIPAVEREEYLESHPANRAWLSRHSRVDAAHWRAGIVEAADLADGRRLHLAFERDPMEVLRMGTRVGSCLSVGGCHSDSAVAVMADVNKRVVVARDASGAFVARQLVAIAEDDRLVCSPVYPLRCGDGVEEVFVRYDRSLAGALALEIHRGPEHEYQIARLVARAFYDDGAWVRLIDKA